MSASRTECTSRSSRLWTNASPDGSSCWAVLATISRGHGSCVGEVLPVAKRAVSLYIWRASYDLNRATELIRRKRSVSTRRRKPEACRSSRGLHARDALGGGELVTRSGGRDA